MTENLEHSGGEVMEPMKPAEINTLIRSDRGRLRQVARLAGIKDE